MTNSIITIKVTSNRLQKYWQRVAEGIETTEQLEAVLELRYHAGQGYLLGRPAPTLVTDPVPLLDLVADVDQTVPAA